MVARTVAAGPVLRVQQPPAMVLGSPSHESWTLSPDCRSVGENGQFDLKWSTIIQSI